MQALQSFARCCPNSFSRCLKNSKPHFFFSNSRLPPTQLRRLSTNIHFKADKCCPFLAKSLLAALRNAPNVLGGLARRYASQQASLTFAGRSIQPRFFSANSTFEAAAVQVHHVPILAPPAVGRWLLLSSVLVYGVIVVGGVTRLTESGLSITEWRPITGVLPPLGRDEWEAEFTKYKATPEFKLLNSSITLDDFKRIFYMEWGHRILGRVVGIAFVAPLLYYTVKKKLTPGLTTRFVGMAALIGLQGLLGWYMVKSGLEQSLMDTPGAVPRVSQYRLAAHYGTAVVLYAAMFGTGLAVLQDWRFAKKGLWNKLQNADFERILANPIVRRFRGAVWGVTGLVFLTALSGAFVAGLDAGLLYNEFPLMGGRLAPPGDELMNPAYATKHDQSDMWWRNLLENPTTVQFDHRVLATTTYLSTAALYGWTLTPAARVVLPALTRTLAGGAFAMANVQLLLGISTLLYLVPVPLAAAHQAGSIALLTIALQLALTLRRPGRVAQIWRQRMPNGLASGNRPESV